MRRGSSLAVLAWLVLLGISYGVRVHSHIGVDVWVNNAGYGLVGSVEQTTEDDMRRIWETKSTAGVRDQNLSRVDIGATLRVPVDKIDLLLNQRVTVGCFPWRFVDGESSIGRCVAFVDDDEYEALMRVKAGLGITKFGDAFNPAHVEQINALEAKTAKYTDAQLQGKTAEFLVGSLDDRGYLSTPLIRI